MKNFQTLLKIQINLKKNSHLYQHILINICKNIKAYKQNVIRSDHLKLDTFLNFNFHYLLLIY